MDNAQVTEAEELIEALSDEADLCRNDGANDIADLLDEARKWIARHRLERSEPVGWMGIESAPKDWTDVLVFSPEHEGFNCGGVFSAFYAEGEENCWFAHGPAHNIRLNPTHWQPLPSAPGTTTPEPVAEIERLRELLREAAKGIATAFDLEPVDAFAPPFMEGEAASLVLRIETELGDAL